MQEQRDTTEPAARRWSRRGGSVWDWCHGVVFGAFLLACGFELWLRFAVGRRLGPPVLLLVLALLTTVMRLARQLSWQNAVAAAAVVGLVAAGAQALPMFLGERSFAGLRWWLPVVWVVMVLSARGVARLALRRWRSVEYYGFWLIGVAGVLVVLQGWAVQASWADVQQYFLSMNIFWELLVSVAAQLGAVPWLINKRPGAARPDYHPLAVWLALSLVLLAHVR